MKTRVQKWGNSLALRIPKSFAEEVGLRANSAVELSLVDGALVVQCVLAIEDEEEHSTHFMVRDAGLDGLRPHLKYIDRLDDIRRVQDHIVRRAKRHQVPVITSTDLRTQIDAVLELVLASAEQVQRV